MLPLPSNHSAVDHFTPFDAPLISTLLWWKPMNGPTSEELHSPDETPVLGAMMLFTIFALQLVSACSHRMLLAQFDPYSNTHPHCRMLSARSPFSTLPFRSPPTPTRSCVQDC